MAAAWLATIVVMANFGNLGIFQNLPLLTANILLATLSLFYAVEFDEKS
jgi:hypothetical protein